MWHNFSSTTFWRGPCPGHIISVSLSFPTFSCSPQDFGRATVGVQVRKASWSRLLDLAKKIQDTQLNLNFR